MAWPRQGRAGSGAGGCERRADFLGCIRRTAAARVDRLHADHGRRAASTHSQSVRLGGAWRGWELAGRSRGAGCGRAGGNSHPGPGAASGLAMVHLGLVSHRRLADRRPGVPGDCQSDARAVYRRAVAPAVGGHHGSRFLSAHIARFPDVRRGLSLRLGSPGGFADERGRDRSVDCLLFRDAAAGGDLSHHGGCRGAGLWRIAPSGVGRRAHRSFRGFADRRWVADRRWRPDRRQRSGRLAARLRRLRRGRALPTHGTDAAQPAALRTRHDHLDRHGGHTSRRTAPSARPGLRRRPRAPAARGDGRLHDWSRRDRSLSWRFIFAMDLARASDVQRGRRRRRAAGRTGRRRARPMRCFAIPAGPELDWASRPTPACWTPASCHPTAV